jgi:hypothetical protein
MSSVQIKPTSFLGAVSLFIFCFIPGCIPPSSKTVVLSEGFEQAAPAPLPFVPNMPPPVITNEQVHTGNQAVKLDWTRQNAILCSTTWQAISNNTWGGMSQQFKHLRLKIWAWMPLNRRQSVTISVLVQRPSIIPGNVATVLHIQRLELHQVIRQHEQWMPSTLFVTLPSELLPLDEVVVCAWGADISERNNVYLDDVSLEDAN